jgi:hypothetical protein
MRSDRAERVFYFTSRNLLVRKASFCSPAAADPTGAPVGADHPPVTGTSSFPPPDPIAYYVTND